MIMFGSSLPNSGTKGKKEQEKWRSEESNEAAAQPKRKRFNSELFMGLFNKTSTL